MHVNKLPVGLRTRVFVCVEKGWGLKCQVIPGINALMKTHKFTSRTGSGAPLLTTDCSFLAVCPPLFWKIFTRSSQWRSSWERNFNCSGIVVTRKLCMDLKWQKKKSPEDNMLKVHCVIFWFISRIHAAHSQMLPFSWILATTFFMNTCHHHILSIHYDWENCAFHTWKGGSAPFWISAAKLTVG